MAASCNVYRSGHDCTGGGITSKVDSILLVGVDGPFEPKEGEPFLVLKRKKVGGREYLYAEPGGTHPKGMCGPMFGGNFVYTSDSRFHDVSPYPIPVHDRYETWEAYEHLSR